MGRQAARRQLRDRRAGQQLLAKERKTVLLATSVPGTGTAMAEFAAMTNLEVWYAHVDVDEVIEHL